MFLHREVGGKAREGEAAVRAVLSLAPGVPLASSLQFRLCASDLSLYHGSGWWRRDALVRVAVGSRGAVGVFDSFSSTRRPGLRVRRRLGKQSTRTSPTARRADAKRPRPSLLNYNRVTKTKSIAISAETRNRTARLMRVPGPGRYSLCTRL